jgi:hypothetical protein
MYMYAQWFSGLQQLINYLSKHYLLVEELEEIEWADCLVSFRQVSN